MKKLTERQKFKKTGMKSKERVKKVAEVFTPGWCVRNMLDMVAENGGAFKNINETFLEPACGDGNFIIQIIERKMHIIDELLPTKEQYKMLTIQAVSKIYGVDIMPDNVQECKERVMRSLRKKYLKKYNEKMPEAHEKNLMFVLDNNIVLGNFLTTLTNDNKPVVIRDYQYNGDKVVISDFYLSDIIKDPEHNKPFKTHNEVLIDDIITVGGVAV